MSKCLKRPSSLHKVTRLWPDTQAGSNPLSETLLFALINAVTAQRGEDLSPYLSQRSRLVLALIVALL